MPLMCIRTLQCLLFAAIIHQQVVDTIGAGDFFTAGFLTAHLQGASLQRCAVAGCTVGAQAVQVSGAEMSPETWAKLASKVSLLILAPSEGPGAWVASRLAACRSIVSDTLRSKTITALPGGVVLPLSLLGLGLGLFGLVARRLTSRGG